MGGPGYDSQYYNKKKKKIILKYVLLSWGYNSLSYND
jgi:hypothetical protein